MRILKTKRYRSVIAEATRACLLAHYQHINTQITQARAAAEDREEAANNQALTLALRGHSAFLARLRASEQAVDMFFAERWKHRAAIDCELLMQRLGVRAGG